MSLEKIDIAILSLSRQKIIEPRGCSLEFNDDYLIYKLRFLAEEPQDDESLPWTEVDNDFEYHVFKKNIVAVDKQWIQKEKRWKIILCVMGMQYDICIFFKKQTECEAIHAKLINWLFNLKTII